MDVEVFTIMHSVCVAGCNGHPQAAHLAGIVQQLVLKLADIEDLLEHLVELLFTKDEL